MTYNVFGGTLNLAQLNSLGANSSSVKLINDAASQQHHYYWPYINSWAAVITIHAYTTDTFWFVSLE